VITAAQFLEDLGCTPIPPSQADVEQLEELFYEIDGNGAGGSLHIVLDDGNWDRDSIEFCVGYARENGDEAGRRFAEWLLANLTDQQMHDYFCSGYDECGRDYVGEHPCLKSGA
jgi:hypothetical protein